MNLPPNSLPADPIDAQVQRDLVSAFRARLGHDSGLVLLGHGFLITVVATALADDGLGTGLIWWIGALVLTTVMRAGWQRAVRGPGIPDASMFHGIRVLTTLQALAWGCGGALLLPEVQPEGLVVVLIGLAGLASSAVSTLVADPVTMRLFVTGIYGPLVVSLVTGPHRHSPLIASLALAFSVVSLLLHRRSHLALRDNLRNMALLSASYLETAREKAYLAGLLRSVPSAVAVLDDAKRIRSVNAQFQQLFGYTAEEAIGKLLPELLVPDSGMEEHQRLEDRLRAGQPVGGELRRRTKDGRVITVRMSAAAVEDPSTPGLVVLYEDITEERRAREALQERERRLSQLVDSNIVGVAFWDLSGLISEANDEYLRIVGYDRHDLDAGGVNFHAMTAAGQAPVVQAVLEQVERGTPVTPWEHDVIRKDGSQIAVLLGVAPLSDRRDKGVVFALDLSARREAQEQLAWKTALLEAQVRSSLDGILVVDGDRQTILTNQRLADLWQFPPTTADTADDNQRLAYVGEQTAHPEEFIARVEHLYAHPEETSREEIELKSGVTLDRYSAPVTGRDGEHYGRIWTFRDVTDAKRAERAMRAARDGAEAAAQSRSMFLANMSHEIRTPMNAVLGMIEIVLDSELTADQRHSLTLASASAESLLGIINDVLDFTKIEADRLDTEEIPFDLPKLVQSTAGVLAGRATERGLELIVDLAPDLPSVVRGDPTRVRQVLTNLLGNAIKFTERGEVIVTARPVPMEDGRPGVRIAVRDTGIGIPEDKVQHVFEEFTQADGSTNRRFGGTGLGLTISQRLVTRMGGTLSVTSEVGRGSEFEFALPLAAEPVSTAAPSLTLAGIAGKPLLVVDDCATNRLVLDKMLTAAGARVTEANGATAALAILRAAHAAGTGHVLAIVDVRMPQTDGFELARQIRSDPGLAGTPLLMLTSSGQRGDAARCRELGVRGYLTKPVSRADLLEAVAAILGGHDVAGVERPVITRHSLADAREPLRILLAEDNPVNQEVAATMLRKRGHRVDFAMNGREAVAAVRAVRYDVILMDIQMPEMDGYEATAQIRDMPAGREVPIIALTAHAYPAERARCLAAGMAGFLSKPFKSKDLFAAVEGVRAGPGTPALATPAAPPTRAVDLDGFRQELRESGAEAALDGILGTFLESVPDRVETLRGALASGTLAEVATAAHALKSSTGAIGARPIAALLGEIESASRSDSLGDRAGLTAQLDAGMSAVFTELRAYRATAP